MIVSGCRRLLAVLAACATLAACASGVTPDCSGDGGMCGYDQPAPLGSADAGSDVGVD